MPPLALLGLGRVPPESTETRSKQLNVISQIHTYTCLVSFSVHTITSNSTPNDPFATGLLRRVQVAAVEVPSSFGPRPQMQHVRLIRVPEEAKAREQVGKTQR